MSLFRLCLPPIFGEGAFYFLLGRYSYIDMSYSTKPLYGFLNYNPPLWLSETHEAVNAIPVRRAEWVGMSLPL